MAVTVREGADSEASTCFAAWHITEAHSPDRRMAHDVLMLTHTYAVHSTTSESMVCSILQSERRTLSRGAGQDAP